MDGVGPNTTGYGTLQAQPPLDRAIAELATSQYGVVEIGQLKRLGLSATGVRNRVAAGRLHRIFRGVYAVGRPTIDQRGRWMAAVLACGRGAVLSHRSAGAHLCYHATRGRFERDRRRDQALMLAGWRVVRFTWRQVFQETGQVIATVIALLEQAKRRGA